MSIHDEYVRGSRHEWTLADGTRLMIDTRVDRFGRCYATAVGYTRRTDTGLRCMPVIRNLSPREALRIVRSLREDPANSGIAAFADTCG